MGSVPALSREQILARRRVVGRLVERRSYTPDALAAAALAGLQDSMPRAAVLSLHARVEGVEPNAWQDPTLLQLWGPRYSVFAIAGDDLAVFTLGRLPEDERALQRANDTADRMVAALGGDEQPFGDVARSLGVGHNSLRYAATTGRILLRWDGARQPTVRATPAPDADPDEARAELVRRFLRVYGPAAPDAYKAWAGVGMRMARSWFKRLGNEIVAVSTPIGTAWLLAEDLDDVFEAEKQDEPVRLLPSGDAYYLLQGEARNLMVPDPADRDRLWTSRVWPGAILAGGEIVGTWRRSGRRVTLEPWLDLDHRTREDVEAEALRLPLPPSDGEPAVDWVS